MKAVRYLALIVGLIVGTAVLAQYQWIDRDGRRVFSDTPPPADLPQKNLLSQPRAPQAAAQRKVPEAAASAASAPVAAAQADAKPDRHKPTQVSDASKTKAQQAAADATRADNCRRALGAKAALDSGQRLARINERGEREFIDDTERAAEQRRLQEIIRSECN